MIKEKCQSKVDWHHPFRTFNKIKVMKLIKINTDHYIIVDDSEIQTGDWYYDTNDKESLMPIYQRSQDPKFYSGCKKITHSTQPLEEGATIHGVEHKRWVQIKYIYLDEVKELLGEVNVEKKAMIEYEQSRGNGSEYADGTYSGYINGYKQALEDNKDKKYTEEDMEAAVCFGMILERFKDDKYKLSDNEEYKGFISSLQPKTEWEVEIIDGQLKLK